MKNTQNPHNAPETAQNPENLACIEASESAHEFRMAHDFEYFLDYCSQLNANK
jgi:hypothetical protein